MDKYHIYEEIGKGEFSQVFKGREKKKIEYVAIKRIEKSVMQKIVGEVQIMHKLNSAHILRFYDWYETRNNLWLILEYCTGGDLESILKQDGHLPETSVKIFGLDIIAGVKYLHSQGLIHTDLRPKNFLVDEYGILKLADFKLVQKIPTKLLSESQLALEARGCPPYMAPEIITGEGIHSYQSDFWSVGCILYELRRGMAPFGDQESSVGDLIAKIRSIEPVSTPVLFRGKDADKKNAAIPPISAELADMIQWLLEKTPMNRCTWVELSDHPFWGQNKPAPPTSLPPQHVFDALVRDQEKHRTQQIESDTNREYGVLSYLPGQSYYDKSNTPLKLPVSESTPIRPAPPSRTPQHHLQHQQHQQPEMEVPVVISPSKQADEKIVSRQEVRALNMESSAKILSNIESKWNDDKSSNQESKKAGLTRVPSEERIINLSLMEDKSVVIEQPLPPAQKRTVPTAAAAAAIVAAPSTPSAAPQSKDSSGASPRPSTAGRDERKGAFDLYGEEGEDKSASHASPFKKAKAIIRSRPNDELGLITLLVHPSDTQVKPIVGNKAIEVIEKPGFNDEALPFDVLSLEDLLKQSPSDVEYHLTQVHKCLSKSMPVAQSTTPTPAILAALQERVNALGYLCAIASAPEISNVVLNTPFLATVLKLMKAIPQYNSANAITAQARTNTLAAGTRGSTLSNGIATLTANVVTVATASRTLAATALAILLRFATFIQPPTIRLREEHIIPSVVALLKETQRMDPKFKRRAVAALGETIFYITAQEEENTSQDGNTTEKWVIPNSAIDMMGRCLRDDTDETIRHYAAKTIENVFAQGGLEFRRRFSTFDIAVRLLELSQSSKSEALQASCGMALSHMFLFIMTPNSLPPLSSTAAAGFNGELSTTLTKKTGLSAPIAPPNVPDPFIYPIPVSGAKFIAKVLEKGGLSGIIETLKDGQPKLQQAYLSILNVIFCSPINLDEYCNRSVDEFSATRKKAPGKDSSTAKASDVNGILQAVNVSLRLTRQYFIKSALMIPLVIKLIDQGATSAIRGKAFIAAHLLCKLTPPSLATLGERRLPQILVKLLEPILSQITAEGPGGPPVELSYVAKTAICMVNYIRDVSEDSSQTIVDLLNTLIQSPTLEIRDDTSSQAGQSSLKTPEPSPDKMSAMRNRKTPQSAAPLKHTPGASTAANGGGRFDIAKLRAVTEMLLSAISIASQPGLRKLILALDGQFVFNLSEALKRLPTVHAALAVHGGVQLELQEALESVEQALLISLETLSQVDLLDDGSSAGPPSLSSVRNNLSPAPKNNHLLDHGKVSTLGSLLSEEGWEFFIESYVLNLVPSVCLLINHHSGNVRAIVASSLRRVIPSAVRMCLLRANQDIDSPLNQEVAITCINQYVSRVTTLLADSAPIPQYAVRVLSDVALISKGVTLTVVNELRRYEVSSTLINMLRESQESEDGGEVDDDTPISVDPQLMTLFRTLFEYNEGAVLLLECDLASALCHALLRQMYAHLDLSNENITESIQMLIDMLYIALQFVLQSLARANNDTEPIGPRAMPKAEKQYLAEQNRRMAAPLRAVIPALLLVFIKVDQFYEANGHRRHEDPRGGAGGPGGAVGDDFKVVSGVLNHLVDCSSVCLALLFDLFQEAATNQLLSKQSVMVDTEVTTITVAGYEDIISPRMVLAKLLGNVLMESKVKARILKIIHAVCKLVINSNAKPKAQEYLCQEPLFPTLQKIFKTYNSREALGNAAENAAFAKLVLQILDFANSM